MTHNKLDNALFILPVTAAGTVNRGRAVTVGGYQWDGVTYIDYAGIARETTLITKPVSYVKYGVGICESGAVIAKGALVGLDTSGRIVTNTSASTQLIVGRTLEAATAAGEEIRVLLGEHEIQNTTSTGLTIKGVAAAQLDATAGLAIGAHSLLVTLPDNAIMTRAYYDVTTTFTSGTDAGTIALHANGANDIVTATAISAGGNVFDAGLHEAIEDGTAANMVKLTADRAITATVAVEDLTDGKLVLFVEYVLSI